MKEFDNIERDFTERVGEIKNTRFIDGTSIEIIREVHHEPPTHAIFDFDGTLSLIRQGWQDVMVPMMVEVLAATGSGESEESLAEYVKEYIYELTGKQTIYQMMRLAEEVTKRGGTPEEPVIYKHRYHDRLMERIEMRRRGLMDGSIAPREMLVPYSYELLAALREKGVSLFLASGTDEHYVLEEAKMLGLDPYFGGNIFGAVDDYKTFSKHLVIKRILEINGIEGKHLIGFGDGYVEIDNVKETGGIAVGVASDEEHRSGKPDVWKRERLIRVGADIIVPDFRDSGHLLDYLWNANGGRHAI